MEKALFTTPLSVRDVKVNDPFWQTMMEKVRTHVIPYQWEALNDRIPDAEPSYCMQNFRVAAGLTEAKRETEAHVDAGNPNNSTFSGSFNGCVFQDSDFAKWVEAVGYSLSWHPDAELEKIADDAIDLVCSAQQDDGYLNTYYIINGLEKRFTNLKDHHEMYCLGHMLEGAIAYYQGTGKDKLLQAMIRYVDCVDRHIGPEEGKMHGYPGHEILEMALMRLYAITKDPKHLKLAKYFVDQRGQQPLYFKEETERNGNRNHWADSYFQYQYYQAGKPVRDQHIAEGHAVRAVYLYSGMADVARATGDDELYQACKDLFHNIEKKQSYITGAIGQAEYGEAFSYDYDLPNDTVYAESCAQIGLVFFARRMLEISPNRCYSDLMERALFNGLISGMSLDGKSFFYVNPLEVVPEACEKDRTRHHVKPVRQKWFGCACCPPNIARLLSSIGTYAYTVRENALYTHLFMGSDVSVTLGGEEVGVKVATNYPWDETVSVSFSMHAPVEFDYAIRIPAWCKQYTLTLNGKAVSYEIIDGYAHLNRLWTEGDQVELVLNMPVVMMQSNPRVRENIGRVAVQRGPVVYCLEEADNGADLHRVCVGDRPNFKMQFEADLLGGVVTLTSDGKMLSEEEWDEENLYLEVKAPKYESKTLKWIPYFVWANRGLGEMLVWVHR